MDALSAAGVGEKMRLPWIHIIFNTDDDPLRAGESREINGTVLREFPTISSGLAQGYPLSSVLFLFVAEALHRLIRNDINLRGRIWVRFIIF